MRNQLGRNWGMMGVIMLLISGHAQAHKVSSATLQATIDTHERTFLIEAEMEVLPSEEEEINEQISPEEAARVFAEEYLNVLLDDVEIAPKVEISILNASDEETPPELQRQAVLVALSGSMPREVEEFLLYLEPTCPMAVVLHVVKDGRRSRRTQVILPGEYSRTTNVMAVTEGDPFLAERIEAESVVAAKAEEEGPPVEFLARAVSAFVTGWKAFWCASFLPLALVIAIFLPSTRRKAVFLQAGAFMIGTCLFLALAAWNLLTGISWIVLVSAAILVVLAGELLIQRRFHWWRVVALFIAGLGVGWLVAGYAIPRVGLFENGQLQARLLVGMVLGVELAAVAACVAAAIFFLLMSRFDWFEKTVVTPTAVVLVGFAIFTLVDAVM